MNNKHLVVIVGPTAVGKTEFTVDLAIKLGAKVLNADSRQVFKELAIGTAKPSIEEMKGVPHYFVNDRSIQDDFSAGHFEKEGLRLLEKIFEKEDIAILSGGSGLYIDALCFGFSDFPIVDTQIRDSLNTRVEDEGVESLFKQLQQLDPEYANSINAENQQRIVRALEVCLATGNTFTSYRVGSALKRGFNIHFIGLELPREVLYERINKRMDLMIEHGLFEEAKMNSQHQFINALKTVGYSEIFGYFEGLYDKTEAIRLLKRNSRRYAKRQLTWFKKNELVQWFEPTHLEQIISYLEKRLS